MTDADAFELFVRQYEDMVFATAIRLLGDAVEAEDVAQTAFLKAFERFDQIGASPTAGGWLKAVTTNLCLNHLSRYRARWRFFSEMPAADETPDGEATTLTTLASPAYDFAHAEDLDRFERALQALPDHQRVPLVLFHFDGATYEEIALKLRVTVGKVKTDIHRGRLALRRVLGDDHGSR